MLLDLPDWYLPQRFFITNEQPDKVASPGLSFYIPQKTKPSARRVCELLYRLYDERMKQPGLRSTSHLIGELFPDVLPLTDREIDDAYSLGYTIIYNHARSYSYHMMNEYLMSDSGPQFVMPLPLVFIVMKSLFVMSRIVRHTIEEHQMTLPSIESKAQIAMLGDLYHCLSDLRTRRPYDLSRMDGVNVWTKEEFTCVTLKFARMPAEPHLELTIRIVREKPLIWYVDSNMLEFFGQMLKTARHAYAQIIRVPNGTFTTPNFLLDQSILLTFDKSDERDSTTSQ